MGSRSSRPTASTHAMATKRSKSTAHTRTMAATKRSKSTANTHAVAATKNSRSSAKINTTERAITNTPTEAIMGSTSTATTSTNATKRLPTSDTPTKATEESISTAKHNEYDDGIAFRFKLPDGLGLHAVDITDGVPKLRFVPMPKVSALTEEDVAVCVRLSQEKSRPEFFYTDFLVPNHPFHGRKYKDYRPGYLRGTSVGELLAEADWLMKCLSNGVQSNETKTKFWSWREKSQLNGLATYEEFPITLQFPTGTTLMLYSSMCERGSVIMTCKSVEVEKSENEMIFGNPKMAINSSFSPAYSKYITEIFDSVAYYDAPLFLKVKELIKLILAMEWLHAKKFKFSQKWLNEYFNPSRLCLCPQQSVAVKWPKEVVQFLLKKSLDAEINSFMSMQDKILLHISTKDSSNTVLLNQPTLEDQIVNETYVKLKTVHTIHYNDDEEEEEEEEEEESEKEKEEVTEEKLEKEEEKEVKAKKREKKDKVVTVRSTVTYSFDDFDELYKEMDPNTPIRLTNGKPVVPGVKSWSELFHETVPMPYKCCLLPSGKVHQSVHGGVTTANIPVLQYVNTTQSEAVSGAYNSLAASQNLSEVQVGASASQEQIVYKNYEPPPAAVAQPSRDVHSKIPLCKNMNESVYGYEDGISGTLSQADGKPFAQQTSIRFACSQEISQEGQCPVRLHMHGHTPLPSLNTEQQNSLAQDVRHLQEMEQSNQLQHQVQGHVAAVTKPPTDIHASQAPPVVAEEQNSLAQDVHHLHNMEQSTQLQHQVQDHVAAVAKPPKGIHTSIEVAAQ